jgi:cyclase
MMERALIVARLRPGAERDVARIFAESDATSLPGEVGVRHRSLYALGSLYLHFMELDGDVPEAMARAQRLPEFRRVSDNLRPFIEPYDPETWRSPKDALARAFYRWDAPARAEASTPRHR